MNSLDSSYNQNFYYNNPLSSPLKRRRNEAFSLDESVGSTSSSLSTQSEATSDEQIEQMAEKKPRSKWSEQDIEIFYKNLTSDGSLRFRFQKGVPGKSSLACKGFYERNQTKLFTAELINKYGCIRLARSAKWTEEKYKILTKHMSMPEDEHKKLVAASIELKDLSVDDCRKAWQSHGCQTIAAQVFTSASTTPRSPEPLQTTTQTATQRRRLWLREDLEVLVLQFLEEGTKEDNAKKVSQVLGREINSCRAAWDNIRKPAYPALKPYVEKATYWSEAVSEAFAKMIHSEERSKKERFINASNELNKPLLECYAKWLLISETIPPLIEPLQTIAYARTKRRRPWTTEELEVLVLQFLEKGSKESKAQKTSETLGTRGIKACRKVWNNIQKQNCKTLKPYEQKAIKWLDAVTEAFTKMINSDEGSKKERLVKASEELNKPLVECFAKWMEIKKEQAELITPQTQLPHQVSCEQQDISGIELLLKVAEEKTK